MSPRKPKVGKRREAERDYSHRSRLDKLGVKTGQRVVVLGLEDAAFLDELAARTGNNSRKPADDADLVFFEAQELADLNRLKSLKAMIKKNGAIWVVYPKGRKDIREIDVIAAGKEASLTDNKVCRFSDTHTALRFVIPIANR